MSAAETAVEGFAHFAPPVIGSLFKPVVQHDVAGVEIGGPTEFLSASAFTTVHAALEAAGGGCPPGYLFLTLRSARDFAPVDLTAALTAAVRANSAPVIRIALLDGEISAATLTLALACHVVIVSQETSAVADWSNPATRGALLRRLGEKNLLALPRGRRLSAQAMLQWGIADIVGAHPIDDALAYVRKNRRRHNGELAVYRSREHSLHVGPAEMERHQAYWPFGEAPRAALRPELELSVE